MEPPTLCPRCRRPLALAAPQGLCPACLLQAGFATGTAITQPDSPTEKKPRFHPPTPLELAPLFPQLEILELIGQGGMGAVYKARQPALERLVALKILPPQAADDPGFAERFAREARALARLSHPNIVAVYDYGQAGPYNFLLMELVDGANLRQIERAGRVAPREALEIIPQICEALQFAHDEGIVHRDIKPENILLDKKGRVKIADFGLAKIFTPGGAERSVITEAGHVMGTPHYMAPEQVERPLDVDHRADIYSLGVVFYEMLTGELPLGKFAVPSQKSSADARLDEVVLRTLEKEPDQRYQQASQLKTAVETVSGLAPAGGPNADSLKIAPLLPNPASTWRGRLIWLPALVLALLLLIGDGVARYRGIWETTDSTIKDSPVAIEDPNSLSGYQFNQHQLILPAMGSTGYHWIMETERMYADLGNRTATEQQVKALPVASDGRWSSSLHWIVFGLAWLYGATTGQPAQLAIAWLAPLISTLLLVVLLLVLVPIAARRFGPWAAALFALGCVATYPFFEFYTVGYFDDPSLIASCNLVAVLCIAGGGAGWLKNNSLNAARLSPVELSLWQWLPEIAQARRWFIASAIAGGIGAWLTTDSVKVFPALAGLAAAALLATGWLGRGLTAASPWRTEPALWRLWGGVGAVTSLACYFLQYSPSDFTQRGQIALRALAWVGLGDLLCRLCRWMNQGRVGLSSVQITRELALLVLDVALIILLPVIVLASGKSNLLFGDPFLQSLYDDYVLEHRSLFRQISYLSPLQVMVGISLLPLLGFPLAALLGFRDLARPWKALVLTVLVPAVVLFGLSLTQIRWLGMDCALWLAGLIVAGLITTRANSGFRWAPWSRFGAAIFLAVILLPYPGFSLYWMVKNKLRTPTSELDLVQVVTRDVAQRLRFRTGEAPALIATGPTTTLWTMYFGGFNGLGTIGVGNVAGLKTTAAIYGAPTSDQARALMEDAGVTYLVNYSWDLFAYEYARLNFGLRRDDPAPPDSFIVRIVKHQEIPVWLRPVPYSMPDRPSLKNQFVQILEFVPHQTRDEAEVRIAQWLAANQQGDQANVALQAVLKRNPTFLPAGIALAHVQWDQKQLALFRATLDTIKSLLKSQPTLAFEDQASLAQLFEKDGDDYAAAQQIRQSLEAVDEPKLRHLTLPQIADFLRLAGSLKNLSPSQSEFLQRARTLVPPALLPKISPAQN